MELCGPISRPTFPLQSRPGFHFCGLMLDRPYSSPTSASLSPRPNLHTTLFLPSLSLVRAYSRTWGPHAHPSSSFSPSSQTKPVVQPKAHMRPFPGRASPSPFLLHLRSAASQNFELFQVAASSISPQHSWHFLSPPSFITLISLTVTHELHHYRHLH